MTDKALVEYIRSKGWKVRIADKDVKDANGKTPSDLAPYIARATSKTLPYLFVVDQDGTIRTECVVPETSGAMLDLLKKLGGVSFVPVR